MPAKSRTLKAVTEADTAAPAPRKTVTKAAAEGSHLELLVAMRARVATAVEDPNTPARDLAALTRRLMEIAKDIEAIKLAEEQEGRGAEATPDDAWDASAI
ncbi:MAG: hypothetical protein ACXVXN_02090 [Mycobacteriaceae bacterium]